MKCRVCGVELTDENWRPSHSHKRVNSCKKCYNEHVKKYREDHKEECKEKSKKYREKHKEELKEKRKERRAKFRKLYYDELEKPQLEPITIISDKIQKCIICNRDFNFLRSSKKCCSKTCRKKYQAQYDNGRHKKIYPKYLEERQEYYSPEYIEYCSEERRNKRKTEKGKLLFKKKIAKRNRGLGYNPLNSYFEGSNGHHINQLDVIFIPAEWHFSGHSVLKNYNLEPINTVAFFFLTMQNIKVLSLYMEHNA